MKLRAKILVIFLSSIIISVIIFLFTIWYLVNYGWWAGITANVMNIAADGAASQIQKINAYNCITLKPILNSWKEEYKGMELELLSSQLESICSTTAKQQIDSMKVLIQGLSRHGEYLQERWIVAREIDGANGVKYYLVITVPAKYFTSISFNVNFPKGEGILGKMFMIGLGITLAISSAFAYALTKNISKRFTTLYKEISSIELGNMDIAIKDNSHDEIGYLTVIFNNMSARLKRQIEEEKTFQEERKMLIANISHDLRTPLTSIIGYSESLENNIYETEEEKQKFIRIIRKKALYMNKLLEELLTLSRLESENYTLKKQEIDIAELVREILIEYLPVIENNKFELRASIPEKLLLATVDKDGIARVLRNLLDNAVKYCRDGGPIEFLLTNEDDKLRIELKDNGPGIDNKNLELIFKRFYREDRSRNCQVGGMGLGLAIVNDIIKLHGGKIYAQSTLGKGSTFVIILPK